MNYRALLWVLVAVAMLAMLVGAIEHKIAHPQPMYKDFVGDVERPVGSAGRAGRAA